MVFRDLKANEIDIRVGSVFSSGVSLLLYKNARVDMQILDETVGAENWQREHYECKGNLFCRVGILNVPLDEWIWKSDCGSESNTEKEKGEASDSFKRACVNWGIGRELYTAPFIYIQLPPECLEGKKLTTKGQKIINNLKVEKLTIKNKEITELVISGKDGVVYKK